MEEINKSLSFKLQLGFIFFIAYLYGFQSYWFARIFDTYYAGKNLIKFRWWFLGLLCLVIWVAYIIRFWCDELESFDIYEQTDRLPYYDVWETQCNVLTEQYENYCEYVWTNWHELEQRILWFLSIRCLLLGF